MKDLIEEIKVVLSREYIDRFYDAGELREAYKRSKMQWAKIELGKIYCSIKDTQETIRNSEFKKYVLEKLKTFYKL